METGDSVLQVKGVGEKTAEVLARLGIFSVGDLLDYYPRAYDQYGEIISVSDLREGEVQVVEVFLSSLPQLQRFKKMQVVTCMGKDDTGIIRLTWFNMPYMRNALKLGSRLLLRGRVVRKRNVLTMEQGKILSLQDYLNRKKELQPIYTLTRGITGQTLSKAMGEVLGKVELPKDYLSPAMRKEHHLVSYGEAVKEIHFPTGMDSCREARRRLVFDEFFLFTLCLRALKGEQYKVPTKQIWGKCQWSKKLLGMLPYKLTGAQEKVWGEIRGDLSGGTAMNRLIQGDVGSGKTILALLALLTAVENGAQGSLMAPTEVLARQHYEDFSKMLAPFPVTITLLTGSMTAKEKREAAARIASGESNLIIGTHALIQEKVQYRNLGLVVTDEQHRFGVHQREILADKGAHPHIMVMSATPIPRTLAIILYGDLDISLVDEMPVGRLPIKNCVVDIRYRPTAYDFIRKEAETGHQSYIICPMVEESQEMEGENVKDYAAQLNEYYNHQVSIGILHGKMKGEEKARVMEDFSQGKISVLVSTTVVEVGVNVPTATVMMVENAERFGLAQLHQLRGRVGRGKAQSYCIILSGTKDPDTMKRLQLLNESNDGFYIAEQDLKLRGPGDFFGTRQSGMMEFGLGDIYLDAGILKEANDAAMKVPLEEFLKIRNSSERVQRKTGKYLTGIAL